MGQQTLYLPQVADGDGLQVTFIASNTGSLPAGVVMQYRDDAGNPISLNILGMGSDTSHAFALSPGETRFLTTSATGTPRVGSATVTSTTDITVSAIFSLLNPDKSVLTETGIAASPASDSFALAVDSGQLNTGIALQNLAESDTEVTFTLYPSNASPAGNSVSTTRTLAGRGHLAIFATGEGQLFPNMTGVRGKMVVTADHDVAALTLRQGLGGSPLTTFPIVDTDSTETSFELPQIAKGTIIQTGFVMFNLTSTPGSVNLSLTDNDGNPLQVTVEGDAVAAAGTPSGNPDSTFQFDLAADEALFTATAIGGAEQAGAASITSTVPIGVTAVFTLLDNNQNIITEAGVGASARGSAFSFPVDTTGGFNTGVAIFNNNASSTTVDASFVGLNGQPLSSQIQLAPFQIFGLPAGSTPLPAFGHSSDYVTQIFMGVENQRGRADITTSQEVSLLPLRQGPNTLTTLPIGSGSGGGPGPMGSELLRTVVKNVPITQNVTRNQQLNGGFLLSGSLKGPATLFFLGGVRATSGEDVFTGPTNFLGKYGVIVPTGVFDLQACLLSTSMAAASNSEGPAGESMTPAITFIGAGVDGVVVNGDTMQDINIQAPMLFDVSGTLTNLAGRPGSLIGTLALVFSGTDEEITAFVPVGEDGTYMTRLSPGHYVVSVLIAEGNDTNMDGIPDDITSAASLYNIGDLVVTTGGSGNDFAFPNLANISGTVSLTEASPSGVVPIPDGASVIAADTNYPDMSLLQRCYPISGASFGLVNGSGEYSLFVKNPSMDSIFADMPALNLGTSEEGDWSMPLPGSNASSINGDTVRNFNFPAFPPVATISGTVTGPDDAPVADVTVTALAFGTVTGVANTSFSASTKTDALGHYSLDLLSGTYTLTYEPPPPSLGGGFPFATVEATNESKKGNSQ